MSSRETKSGLKALDIHMDDGNLPGALRLIYEATCPYIALMKASPNHLAVHDSELAPVDYGHGKYAERIRNMIEVSSIRIESEPHDVDALNMAKRILKNMAYDEPSGMRRAEDVLGFKEIEREIKSGEEFPVDWGKHFWGKAMEKNDNSAGYMADSIINDIRELRLSKALNELLPLTDYLVEQEEQGNHILGTRDYDPDEKMVDVRYSGEGEDSFQLSRVSGEFKRVLAISEQHPRASESSTRSKEIAINMMADFHGKGGFGHSSYDILRMAQNYHDLEPMPQA